MSLSISNQTIMIRSAMMIPNGPSSLISILDRINMGMYDPVHVRLPHERLILLGQADVAA